MKRRSLLPLLLLPALFLAAGKPPCPPAPGSPLPLTLDAAIAIALRQNPLIRNAKAEIERAKGLVIEVRSQLLPQVNLSAVYQQEARDLVAGQAGTFGTANAISGAVATPTPTPTPAPHPSPGNSPPPPPKPTPPPPPPPPPFLEGKN